MNGLIEYCQNLGPNYASNNESNIEYQYIYSIDIDKFTMNVENYFTFVCDKFFFDYQYPKIFSWGVYFEKFQIIDLLEINDLNYQNNGFFFDLSISSFIFSISPKIPEKVSKLTFISNLIEKSLKLSNSTSSSTSSQSPSNMFIYITNIKFIETSTKLTLSIPIIKFTTNSLYSISALYIPTMKI